MRQPDAQAGTQQLAWGAAAEPREEEAEDRPGDVTFRLFEGCAPVLPLTAAHLAERT